MYRKTYMKINLDNIKYNIKTILNQYNQYQYYFGIVKANCYNHDNMIIKELVESGINYLAVSSLEEAIEIRNFDTVTPILCLEPISLEYIPEIIRYQVTVTIHDYQYYKQLLRLKLTDDIKVHIKINTGMNRLGIHHHKILEEMVDTLLSCPHIILEGIYSHLATADNNEMLYIKQKNTFLKLLESIPVKQIPIIHLFNSSALLKYDKLDICNGTRLGLIMYGLNPILKHNSIKLKPGISLHSEIIQLNHIAKGEFVGYGANYIAKDDCTIAVIPIGYADGFIRKNQGRDVLIHKKRYPIVGRICMDMTMIQVDDTCHIGDTVTLIGDTISIKEVADHLDTISWEVLCSINDRVTKIFIKNDEIIGEVNLRNHQRNYYKKEIV